MTLNNSVKSFLDKLLLGVILEDFIYITLSNARKLGESGLSQSAGVGSQS
ncbi:hypothetical protein L9Z41_11175 [Leptospira noguchii]|nr:hypothetical protein [Leptospira noguchii]MCH1912478.1 hypothetical protein [Leptospira noguchii]MCH1916179.1 hypothetical protein [Leptospira noguchii]UOG63557.1 hypothetical protein MAL04_15050 [Leptospira noguchii]